ncbi:MAG: fasciclin domain-containing protein [Nocardioides sp.]
MRYRALIGALALAVTGSAFAITPAQAARGETSLVEVLAADGTKFDSNWNDFDIVERAALTVLAAKPDSAVGVLAQGDVKLTAFVPTDRAFRRLVHDLTGKWVASERKAFKIVASLGVDTVEAVLLYHVVPGAVITYKMALGSSGAVLTTAGGGTVTVKVRHGHVWLKDADPNDLNPRVKRNLKDINKGNKQIAHGINRVLRPADL